MASTSLLFQVDDFDPLVHYADYTVWTTPNPQDHPTWYNDSAASGTPWYQATYHNTSTNGATASFNFTGDRVSIYGDEQGSYSVTLDGNEQSFTAAVTQVEGRALLFNASGIDQKSHTLEIKNGDGWLLLDSFEVNVTTALGSAGSDDQTWDDRNAGIKYIGSWTQQTGPNFYNGTSTYTSGPGNAFEMAFEGTSVLVYGDQVNDHGEYTVSINGTAVATHNGRSGCGGGFAKACEKLHGLKFLGGPYPAGTHTLRIENGGPADGNKTFFDFDYVQWFKPKPQPQESSAGGNSTGHGSTGSPAGGAVRDSVAASGVLFCAIGAWVLGALVELV